MTTVVRSIDTPEGEARVHVDRSRHPVATLVLGHGAGGGVDAPDLVALARALPRDGISVVRVEQPWRVAGKKVASPPDSLDRALLAVMDRLRPRTPLFLGGRSAGARSAARLAGQVGAMGVIALAFPFHPPGRPEKSRLAELTGAGAPALVFQGERDPFGRPEDLPYMRRAEVVAVPFADHSFETPRRSGSTQSDALVLIVATTRDWILRLAGARD